MAFVQYISNASVNMFPSGGGGNPQDSDTLLLPQGEDSDRINLPHPQEWDILMKGILLSELPWTQGQPTGFWQSSFVWGYNFLTLNFRLCQKVSDAPLPPGEQIDWCITSPFILNVWYVLYMRTKQLNVYISLMWSQKIINHCNSWLS